MKVIHKEFRLSKRKQEGISIREKYRWIGKDDSALTRCHDEEYITKKHVPKSGTKGTASSLTNNKKGISVVSSSSPAGYIATKTAEIVNKAKNEIINTLQRSVRRQMENRKESKNSNGILVLILIVSLLLIPIPTLIYMNLIVENTNASTTIVAVAERELEISDFNIGGKKYKQWYGLNGNWCAMFVSYCANECGYIDEEIMPRSAAVKYMAIWYKEREQWQAKESGYEPKPGDIIFFQNGMSHVGIVISYDAERKIISTIEGNTGTSNTNPYHEGSAVKEKRYPLTYKKITGYGIPNYGF